MMEPCVTGQPLDESFFEEVDKDNGAGLIMTALFEDCSHLELLVGQAINESYESSGIGANLSARNDLTRGLVRVAEAIGKTVTVKYY